MIWKSISMNRIIQRSLGAGMLILFFSRDGLEFGKGDYGCVCCHSSLVGSRGRNMRFLAEYLSERRWM